MNRTLITLALILALGIAPAQAKVVNLEGFIDTKLVESVQSQLESGDTLNLNSLGGYLEPASRLAEFVRAIGINTQVRSTAVCQSSCVLIFAAGGERRAGINAMFLIHLGRDSQGNILPGATEWFVGKLFEYGVNELLALFPSGSDGINLNYWQARTVNLINAD